jgi:ATP-binding cassette subfamily C (CFTR/MRP) protein 1
MTVTEEHICNNLLGKNGLLRLSGTTILIATHAVQRLSYADHIISLDANGRIVEQGSFKHLRCAGGYVQSLAARSKSAGRELLNKPSSDIIAKPSPGEAEQIELSEEDLTRQTGDFEVYKYYFGSVGWVSTTLFFGLCVLFGVSSYVYCPFRILNPLSSQRPP